MRLSSSAQEIARRLELEQTQVNAWLKRAVSEGRSKSLPSQLSIGWLLEGDGRDHCSQTRRDASHEPYRAEQLSQRNITIDCCSLL
jgi:hypothetical protein